MKKSGLMAAGVLLLLLAVIVPVQAGTKTWKAGNTGDWFTAGNWVEGSDYPRAGDDVVITNVGASVLLTNSTEYLSSLTISNTATLVFSNWNTTLSATNAYIRTNATVTLPPAFTNIAMGNNVYIICSNLTMDAGGKIDVNGKGYAVGTVNGGSGYGPGAGVGTGGGGSYGGLGGGGTTTYGSSNAPIDPGSASGRRDASNPGTAGGGAVRIQASGLVTINGTITANGPDFTGSTADSSGSGGGIYITSRTLSGNNGIVRANGGIGGSMVSSDAIGGGGGGGRIAVIYDSSAQSFLPVPNIVFSAAGGPAGNCGDIGTLYFSDTRFITETISHSGQVLIPGFTNWAPNNLTISNGWIRFPWDAFQLTVTNAVTVIGTDARIHKLEVSRLNCGGPIALTNCSLIIKGVAAAPVLMCLQNITLTNSQLTLNGAATTGLTMNCGGDLVLTNGSTFSVYSGRTNASGANYGAWVNIAGNVSVATNAWIYPYSNPTNGGSALFCTRNLALDAGGGINADSKGYTSGGVNGGSGYGPGAGIGTGSGGSYGGLGGRGTRTYGSSNAPIDPGSAAGRRDAGSPGGAGGGAVRLQVIGLVTINGMITANGGNGVGGADSSGAGGGIYVTCRYLGGNNGIVRANGGSGTTDPIRSAGGGGGRIALWRVNDKPLCSISTYVNGGTAAGWNGTNGTIVLGWVAPPGTVFTIH